MGIILMKSVLAAVMATAAARQQELVSIGEKMAQMKRGVLEFDPLTGEKVVRSWIGTKDDKDKYFGDMHTHSNAAEWEEDAPAGYGAAFEVEHPGDAEDDAV